MTLDCSIYYYHTANTSRTSIKHIIFYHIRYLAALYIYVNIQAFYNNLAHASLEPCHHEVHIPAYTLSLCLYRIAGNIDVEFNLMV